MGWLRKSRQRDEEVEQVESDKLEKEEKEIPLAYGPRDWADADEDEDLVDMGAIRLPAIEGMQVTLIPSTGTELDTVVAALGGSSIELRAFAAPRSGKLWPQVREDLVAELGRIGARTQELKLGERIEIAALVPAQNPAVDGNIAMRVLGFDGPRWFLRAVITGPAATEQRARAAIDEIVCGMVVYRDGAPHPPRDVLPLHSPGAVNSEADSGLDILAPGPTIAEVR